MRKKKFGSDDKETQWKTLRFSNDLFINMFVLFIKVNQMLRIKCL